MDLRWLQQATGHGTLDSGALVDPHTVRRWACDAEIVPIVLGSNPSRSTWGGCSAPSPMPCAAR